MKQETQINNDLAELGKLIHGIEVAMLTTQATDGSLVSRPLQTLEFDASGDLVFFTGADSGKIEELRAHPRVNLSYTCSDRRRYVSVRGEARLDRDQATIDALWSEPQRVFFANGKDDANLVVLRIHICDAAYWDSSGNFIARSFDFARGLLSDAPADLGKHGWLQG